MASIRGICISEQNWLPPTVRPRRTQPSHGCVGKDAALRRARTSQRDVTSQNATVIDRRYKRNKEVYINPTIGGRELSAVARHLHFKSDYWRRYYSDEP